MEIPTSNALIGISLIGGIAHVMLYMNGFWYDPFWITGIGIVFIPLLIKKRLRGRKISLRKSRKTKKNSQIEQNNLFDKEVKGNCKICGKPLEDWGLDFCSQNCSFEYYLNSQTKVITNEDDSQVFSHRPEFSYL